MINYYEGMTLPLDLIVNISKNNVQKKRDFMFTFLIKLIKMTYTSKSFINVRNTL